MAEIQPSSDPGPEPDALGLAVLVACQHRGALTASELTQLLAQELSQTSVAQLLELQLLVRQGPRYSITQRGREFLDQVVESIENQLTPDDPAYVRRYQREEPSLPFAANTIWSEAVCVNLRIDPAALRPLIPDVFELDLFDGMAYVSLTASRLKNFGVGWIPPALRMNFYQATYRAHVRHTDFRGRTIRGCYFVRSETNSPLMSLTANILPEFRAHRCSTFPILMARRDNHLVLTVDSGSDPAGQVVLVLDTSHACEVMPATSRFPSLTSAREFIVDFHDAFAYDPELREVLILRIERGDWNIRVCEPVDYYLGYINSSPFSSANASLDSVFYFTDVPYRWLPLVKERIKRNWNPQ